MPRCNDPSCKKEHATEKCANCLCAFYCNKACQKKDWKAHKTACFSPVPSPPGIAPIEQLTKDLQFLSLWNLCQDGSLDPIKAEIHISADLINYSCSNRLLLLTAAAKGHLEWVLFLLEKGADPSVMNNEGETPLWMAARFGHLEVVTVLVNKLNNIEQGNKQGIAPLWIAACYQHLSIMKFLIAQNADIHTKNIHACTPLWVAARNNDRLSVELLIEKKAAINQKNLAEQTPLWTAAKYGCLDTIKILVEHEANIHMVGLNSENKKVTPLEIAKQSSQTETAAYLSHLKNLQATQSAAEESAAEKRRETADVFFKKHAMERGLKKWKQDHQPCKEKKWLAHSFFEAKSLQKSFQGLRRHHQNNLLEQINQQLGQMSVVQQVFYIDPSLNCLLQAPLPIHMKTHLSLLHLLAKSKVAQISISGSSAIQYFWRTLRPLGEMRVDLDRIQPSDLDLVVDCSLQPDLKSDVINIVQHWATHNNQLLIAERNTTDYNSYSICDSTQTVLDKTGLYRHKKLIDITFIISPNYCSNDPIHLTQIRLNLRFIRNLLIFQCALSSEPGYAVNLLDLIDESYYRKRLEITPISPQHPPTKLRERLDRYFDMFKAVFGKPELGVNCFEYMKSPAPSPFR